MFEKINCKSYLTVKVIIIKKRFICSEDPDSDIKKYLGKTPKSF